MADLVFNVLLFIVGLGLLIKGADWLVDSSARIAKQFGVSEFIIGLTIVAIGTSVPEFAASVTASFLGNSELAIGTVIGSNIANVALILGFAGLVVPISVGKEIYSRDGFVMLSATILFYFFCINGILSRIEGALFLFFFTVYIVYFMAAKRPYKREFRFKRYLKEYIDLKGKDSFEKTPTLFGNVVYSSTEVLKSTLFVFRKMLSETSETISAQIRGFKFLFKQVFFVAFGIAFIFFGSNFLVTSATAFPIDQLLVGLFVVAIGTSLPELVVTISALRKGFPAIMIGTIIGSSISNIFFVSGSAALASPILIPAKVLAVDFVFLLLITWMFLVFLRNDFKITRIESLTLLMFYAIFIVVSFFPEVVPLNV